ncbi:hypothetical protein CEXT_414451 [Caerostris extrusa]|uniref:Uncharacterized protein n=1 Tax=Caerostris extrusa TaxID=172846 RepID=A0AAV4NSM0_CAEEX|nr:hypothetical protein CEXT_414451 [Caerostris extrusa]
MKIVNDYSTSNFLKNRERGAIRPKFMPSINQAILHAEKLYENGNKILEITYLSFYAFRASLCGNTHVGNKIGFLASSRWIQKRQWPSPVPDLDEI